MVPISTKNIIRCTAVNLYPDTYQHTEFLIFSQPHLFNINKQTVLLRSQGGLGGYSTYSYYSTAVQTSTELNTKSYEGIPLCEGITDMDTPKVPTTIVTAMTYAWRA